MTETRAQPKPGETWRHCKGTLYQILDLTPDRGTEDNEPIVRYRAHNTDEEPHARRMSNFMKVHSSGAWRFVFVPLIERYSREELLSERTRHQALLDKWMMPPEREAMTRKSLAAIEARLTEMA